MATWKLSPQYKKSAVEKMFFFKDGKIIIREEGFRWATFSVESDEKPLTDAELKNEDYYELGCIDNDESWEMQDMTDGCWAEVTAGNDKTTEEDLAAFNDAWDADWYSGVEALGWSQDECEYYFHGPLELTNEDTGEVFKGEPDENISVGGVPHTTNTDNPIDFPTVGVPMMSLEEKLELVQNLDEENPYTDWFPVNINPVRNGTYQVLAEENETKWPFASNIIAGTWDGSKWDVGSIVVKWRGLANKPN